MPYQSYVTFCLMLGISPASEEQYERTTNKIYPLDLSVYSPPRLTDRVSPIHGLKVALKPAGSDYGVFYAAV